MTRRQLARRAINPQHKVLMFRAHDARGGEKSRAQQELQNFITGQLASCRRRRRRARR